MAEAIQCDICNKLEIGNGKKVQISQHRIRQDTLCKECFQAIETALRQRKNKVKDGK